MKDFWRLSETFGDFRRLSKNIKKNIEILSKTFLRTFEDFQILSKTFEDYEGLLETFKDF